MESSSKLYIEKEIKSFKPKKATRLDELPTKLLKDCAHIISKPLCHIINLSLRTGQVPYIWKSAKITPVYKSGDINKPDSYRPISVLPALSKVLEKAVHTQLSGYLEANQLLSEFQFGYRSNRSTSTAATLFVDNIRKEVDNGKLTGAVFIDLTKAFDTISHAVLLQKLQSYGVRDNELSWFTDYLFQRHQSVSIKNSLLSSMPVFNGVPQGSILGPLLFVIFFNDLPDVLENCRVIKYADDTVVYFSHSNKSVVMSTLTKELSNISSYLDLNELIINLKKGKTEVMLIGTAKRLSLNTDDFTVNYRDTQINHVFSYKYLGILIDSTLNFSQQFDRSYKKASSRIRLLERIRPNITSKVAGMIYRLMILPVFTYCSIVHSDLTNGQIDKLQSLTNRARRIVGDHEVKIPYIYSEMLKQSCMFVRKCLDGNVCANFENYFEKVNHQVNTRSSNTSVKLPKVKPSTAKKSFYYFGAKLYNELPSHIKREENIQGFKSLLNDHDF